MKITIDPRFIHKVINTWEDEQTQEMIEEIRNELKRDCREELRHCSSGKADEVQGWYEDLMGQIQDVDFWCKMEHLLNFSFDF